MSQRICKHCGGPMPAGKRAYALYCCPSCVKAVHRARSLAWYAAHKEEVAMYKIDYDLTYRAAHKEERAAKNAAYNNAHREEKLAYTRDYKKQYPERAAAHRKALRAYQDPEPCYLCGELGTDRHHPDYNFPCYIVWLCASCHMRLHAGWFELIETGPTVKEEAQL